MTRLQQIERGLQVMAYLVVRHGETYVPLLDRLEQELEAEKHRQAPRDRAAKILASLTREVRSVPAAG
jgi:hypothetical protein